MNLQRENGNVVPIVIVESLEEAVAKAKELAAAGRYCNTFTCLCKF